MKRIALFLALMITGSAFAGGSNPGIYYQQKPTPAQWNSYFAAKLDYTPGSANTIPYWDGAGSLLNAPVSGDCSSAANVFTCTIGGAGIHAAPIKSIPVGADEYPIWNSATGVLNKVTFTDSLSWYAAKNGNVANVFSVAPATAATHAPQASQLSYIPGVNNAPSASVYHNSGQTIGAGGGVVIFNTARLDTTGSYNLTTGLYTAPMAGTYLVNLVISGGASGQTLPIVSIRKAGARFRDLLEDNVLGIYVELHSSYVLILAAGETFDIYSSGALFVDGDAAFAGAELQVVKL
jgi:hypothetical protein